MDEKTDHQETRDIVEPEFSDEDLALAAAGGQRAFPTFTCGPPGCATGGGCGTWAGVGANSC